MAWIALLGMILLGAFVTYAVFANAADARGVKIGDLFDYEPSFQDSDGQALADSGLSSKLTEELRKVALAGQSPEAWLRNNRVPYGECTATDDCDMKTRCVQCEFFETTAQDAPALEALLSQELQLAERAKDRKMHREAEVHTHIAASIEQHLHRVGKLKAV